MTAPELNRLAWGCVALVAFLIAFGFVMAPDAAQQDRDEARCASLGGVYTQRTCYIDGEES